MKSLSPVKDLEQPVSASFSSSTHAGGDEAKNAGRAKEEGSEEMEEEEAELNSPSPPWTTSDSPLALRVSSSRPRLLSAPGSESMTGDLFPFCRVILNRVTFWQDVVQLV